MSDTPSDPDWSLLPHDPPRFFGLGAGFDRRELKRSYNQLLRRFKPERFPQEFQRIRAAYEQLDNAIRYGQATDSTVPPYETFEWQSHASPPTFRQHANSTASASHASSIPVHKQIQSSDVLEIYQELKQRHEKSPYDFYSLAVLSDIVDPQEGQQFVRWVLQGLTAHPNEIGLTRLLHAYFSGPVASEHCEALLLECSRILREDLFFPVTEPLWRSLLRTQNFGQFRTALRQCEANLKGLNLDNRLAFYLQILKPAVWLADSDWIDESYKFIEQNFDRIPAFLDYDLEILSRLRAYVQVREQFVQGDAIRQRLDQSMRDYFSEDQITGDQSVLASQVLVGQDVDGLAAAFAEFANPNYAAFFAVWIWLSYDVSERHVEPPKQSVDESVWHPRTKALLNQLERQTIASRLGIKWATRRVVYRGAQAAGFFFCATLLSLVATSIASAFMAARGNRRGDDAVLAVAIPAGVAVGVYFGFRLSKRITARYWQPFSLRISADCYRQIWQREIARFLALSQLSQQTLRAYIHSFPNTTTSTTWIKHYVDLDYTLPLFAIAYRFIV